MGSRQIVLVSTAGFSVLNTGIFWREAKTKRLLSCGVSFILPFLNPDILVCHLEFWNSFAVPTKENLTSLFAPPSMSLPFLIQISSDCLLQQADKSWHAPTLSGATISCCRAACPCFLNTPPDPKSVLVWSPFR
jgi:hypothetical protein